jgi:hypothetical protein
MSFNKKEHTFDAIFNLVGGALAGMADGAKMTYGDGQTPPTQKEIDAELVRMNTEWDALEYARARQPLYPAIGDQLDDLYHKGAFSAEMIAKLKKVKDDNPK